MDAPLRGGGFETTEAHYSPHAPARQAGENASEASLSTCRRFLPWRRFFFFFFLHRRKCSLACARMRARACAHIYANYMRDATPKRVRDRRSNGRSPVAVRHCATARGRVFMIIKRAPVRLGKLHCLLCLTALALCTLCTFGLRCVYVCIRRYVYEGTYRG